MVVEICSGEYHHKTYQANQRPWIFADCAMQAIACAQALHSSARLPRISPPPPPVSRRKGRDEAFRSHAILEPRFSTLEGVEICVQLRDSAYDCWQIRRLLVSDESPLDVRKEGVRLDGLCTAITAQPVRGVPLQQLRDDVLKPGKSPREYAILAWQPSVQTSLP